MVESHDRVYDEASEFDFYDNFDSASIYSGGMDNFCFAQDFLPIRYDRYAQNDYVMKTISLIQIGIDIAILAIFIRSAPGFFTDFSVFSTIYFLLVSICLGFCIFWLNYKLHNVLFSIYRLVMDLNVIKRNDKYYSGCEIPDFFVTSKTYPHVTIQVPVYKESLENTIIPTLLHCIREADRYKEETGARCNIVVCDDGYNLITQVEREARLAYYNKAEVAFTARPHPSKLERRGRFKKAGNLNFSMNLAALVVGAEDEAQGLETADGLEHHPSAPPGSTCIKRRDELVAVGTKYYGDIEYGEYIMLVDSDTRLPVSAADENGCIKRLVKEMMFDGKEVLFIQCYTGPYMSTKSAAEKGIFHHTCNIYNSILMATAIHSMAPLVGHNAFLNKKAMTECARDDETQPGYKLYWAEDRISEDFDMMMRGCEKGYTGRYASYAGVFLEGVSFSYMTEYFKISKFACGAAELIYNPMSSWCRRGVISKDLIGFLRSTKIEWYNKMFILSYTLNFLALASFHWALLFNLIFCEYLWSVVPIALQPINLMWESIFVWLILGTTFNLIFGIRLGFDKKLLFKQSMRESAFLTCLYGSISVKMSIMCFTHLFGWRMSFGATQKDDRRVTLLDWIKSTPMETTVNLLYCACIPVRLIFFTAPSAQSFVLYYGCIPLMWSLLLFWVGPLMFDILPRNRSKLDQDSYISADHMFADKYHMQVPNSKLIKAMKVGSNIKMTPLSPTEDTPRTISGSSTCSTRSDVNSSPVRSYTDNSSRIQLNFVPAYSPSNGVSNSAARPDRPQHRLAPIFESADSLRETDKPWDSQEHQDDSSPDSPSKSGAKSTKISGRVKEREVDGAIDRESRVSLPGMSGDDFLNEGEIV